MFLSAAQLSEIANIAGQKNLSSAWTRLGCARRALTAPGLGALAMMMVRGPSSESAILGIEDGVGALTYAGGVVPARGGHKRYHRIRVRMHHAAPTLPVSVPLIFDSPMRG